MVGNAQAQTGLGFYHADQQGHSGKLLRPLWAPPRRSHCLAPTPMPARPRA